MGTENTPDPVVSAASESSVGVDLRLEELLDPVLVVHRASLTVRAANDRCEEVTGFCVHELVGAGVERLSPRRPPAGHDPVDWPALLDRPGLHDEVPLVRADGTPLLAEISVTRASDGGEEVRLLFVRDLTERRKLERELITKHVALREAYEELARANHELERANEEIRTAQRWLVNLEKMATIGRFAAGVAHEVNNPMAFVLENLSHLQACTAHIVPALRSYLDGDRPGPGAVAQIEQILGDLNELIQDTIDGAVRVSDTMRQLHSFSNVTDQEAEWTNLHELIDASIMMVNSQIRYRARLERYYYDVPRVLCVPNGISQVVVNLLVNAIHAFEDGDRDHNVITVRTRPVEGGVAIEVRDTGCGIPHQHLGRILEPFFTTKPRGKGTGLGLSISAGVVEQHGGSLEVESEVGRGTLMRVVLPVRGTLRESTRSTGARGPGEGLRRLRILLVDDEVYFLRAMRRSLGRQHDVLLAEGALDALEKLATDSAVDLVLSDLMMPDLDGVELHRRIEQTYPELARRVVFMSGGVFEERIRSYIKQAELPVLDKPFRQDEFERVVANLLSAEPGEAGHAPDPDVAARRRRRARLTRSVLRLTGKSVEEAG